MTARVGGFFGRLIIRPYETALESHAKSCYIRNIMSNSEIPQMEQVSLEDKYDLNAKRAYLSGIEALVRLPILQHQRDLDAGLNTACYVSGYRGSPLGTLDQSMWQAKSWLDQHNIHFQPGVNEDLAATAVWGTQQVHLLPGARYDGVFSMWYGKGPGVDRSMDAIKHANLYGTTQHGGVLAIAGDDHACKSSTVPQQSEHMLIGAQIPVLNPANVQDVLDYGLYGWAMSRFSGCWVGLKAITENMDSAVSADLNPDRVQITIPESVNIPEGGLNAQWPTNPLQQERLLNEYRIYAARAFAYANNLNTIELDSQSARFGIVTSGKSYLDVMEAINMLGIEASILETIGIRIFKIGMSWPLEPISTRQFAGGLQEILVVEEKRSVIEDQLTTILYDNPNNDRPVIVGEFDEHGRSLITNLGELNPVVVALAIGRRMLGFFDSEQIRERMRYLDKKQKRLTKLATTFDRTPYFCSGCPHNTSTKVPEGSHGLAGIGCHYMVKWMDRNTETFTQMGAEGASWIGQAPFTETEHIFQNIGDGTYFHSGILAIRAAIASSVNITYKILYNDAVAMTGGQAVDGSLSVVDIVAQLRGEGVREIAVVAEDIDRSKIQLARFNDIAIHPKSEFDALQSRIRHVKGTSVIVFDQTCATEKRRRRKRGSMPDSTTRAFIHPDICEGCGDCSKQSNCLSVLPKATELGSKRQIDQNACNQDFSCLQGFCPSFITVTGGELVHSQPAKVNTLEMVLPEPKPPGLDRPWNILVTGIGGTGVLTVSSVIAMAAHIEGKGCSTLNQTGLAQKFGSVISHVRIAKSQTEILAVRVPDGSADLLLGCDLVVSANADSLSHLDSDRSQAIVNSFETATADFIHDPNYEFPSRELQSLIESEAGKENTQFVNSTRIARDLLGDTIGSNLFLLGYAYQSGLVPLSEQAIFKAIKLNGVAIEFNQTAFSWGRKAAVNPQAVENLAGSDQQSLNLLTDLDEIIEWRYQYLCQYQNTAYADHYRTLVNRIRNIEEASFSHSNPENSLTESVARNFFKLMSYKDEYEIARLISDTDYVQSLKNQYQGDFKLHFHMAPPGLCKTDPHSGQPVKRRFPELSIMLFKLLRKLKGLRGTAFDPFGRNAERQQERQLIADYKNNLDMIADKLTEKNFDTAVEIAALPEAVKGFGHIKTQNIEKYQSTLQALLKKFKEPELALVVNNETPSK